MLYLVYWELNENVSPAEIIKIGAKIEQLGDVEGAETISWLVTPGYWGISLMKVENEAAAFEAATRWRIALPGVFKSWKGSVAMEVAEAMTFVANIASKLSK